MTPIQNFFRSLSAAHCVEKCVELCNEALQQDQSVVIGLQSTGEAALEQALEEMGNPETARWDEILSLPKLVLKNFITNFFPPFSAPAGVDDEGKEEDNGVAGDAGVANEKAQMRERLDRQKQELQQRLEAIALPGSPLDTLVDQLGGPKLVAEMTGRKKRVVRDKSMAGGFKLAERGVAKKVNPKEMSDFMNGLCRL